MIILAGAITFASSGAVAPDEQNARLQLDSLTDTVSTVSAPLGELIDTTQNLTIDSVVTKADTVKRQSRIRREKVDVDNVITINAADSLVLWGQNKALMYGDGKVNYGDLKLEAAQIEVDMKDKTVYAVGRPDSVGELQGKPVFEQAGSTYETKTMSYNFKTKRAYITDVITQLGEGYLTGGYTKKTEDDY